MIHAQELNRQILGSTNINMMEKKCLIGRQEGK